MRNLKRVLSLALALVMVLGMMVIGTSAATFTDAAEINPAYEEAVAVLNGVGLFQGNDDGTLAPKQELNRAMAAVIMARIMLGSAYENLSDDTARQIFSDVPAGEWYSAEVEYCYNNKLIGGLGDGTFDPNGELTGIAFAKLLLVAMGYNAETEGYTGDNWATGIYADAVDNGLDLVGVDMAGALTREQAAQMIFQALEAETVKYNNLEKGAFADGNTFMGKWYPKLEKFCGAITANEYANLTDGDYALYSGLTEIDGTVYVYSSELTDIGESRQGWAVDGVVVFIEDTGLNTVFETGAACDFRKNGKYNFKGVTGMYKYDGTEQFVNFDSNDDVEWTSDFLITYGYTDEQSYTTYNPAKDYEIDFNALKECFYTDDGFVFVGTKSTQDNDDDKSDTMSWREFVVTYLDSSVDNYWTPTTENGEWMKVVDNNGDGYADYIFKTEFVLSTVTDINKKGELTIPGIVTDQYDNDYNTYKIVTSAELAERDVVIYTIIEEYAYVELAEVVTDTINKKGIDKRNETITCGDDVYEQSYIGNYTTMDDEIVTAATEVSYDFYLDHFGYVRAYEESAWGNGFVLLTDGYYWSDKRSEDFQAQIWNGDFEDVTVLGNTKNDAQRVWYDNASNFISTYEGDAGDRGTWDRLYEAELVYGWAYDAENDEYYIDWTNEYVTNIAGYSVNADNEYTLIEIAPGTISNKVNYAVEELVIGKTTKLTNQQLTDGTNRIQTTTDTVYYLVNLAKNGSIDTIESWTGYANAPKVNLAEYATVRAYAVTSSGVLGYDIADVVVFEIGGFETEDLYFVYDNTDYNYITLAYDAETGNYEADTVVEGPRAGIDHDLPVDFYEIDSNGNCSMNDHNDVLGEYEANGIYYAKVNTAQFNVGRRDYVQFVAGAADKAYSFVGSFSSDDVTIYTIGYNAAKKYHTLSTMDYADVEIYDELIVVTNYLGNIEYVINVTASQYYSTYAYKMVPVAAATDLYAGIVADSAKPAAADTYTVNGVGDFAEGETVEVTDLTGPYVAVVGDKTTYVKVVNGVATFEMPAYDVVTVDGYYHAIVNGEDVYDNAETLDLSAYKYFTVADQGDKIYSVADRPDGIQWDWKGGERNVTTYDVKITIEEGVKSAELNGEAITLTNGAETEILANEGDKLDIVSSEGEKLHYVVDDKDLTVPFV